MKLFDHPLWLAGFRPFFALACLSGLSLPLLWVLIYGGTLVAPGGPVSGLQWHAHEMFFGFGWAILGGFLLTSTKNWVQVRGYHGAALCYLACTWGFERIGMALGGSWPPLLFQLSNNLFLGSIVAMVLYTLIRYRQQDAYRDNAFFLVLLPLFLIAKHLLLSADHYQAGWTMALGLFRLAFLVMLERTLSQFMKGVFQVSILRYPPLDMAIKLLGLALVFVPALPPTLAAALALLLAALLLGRFAYWQPLRGLSRIDIGVMYLGYLAIVAQLLLSALEPWLHPAWIGALPLHVFTFGAMGLIVPAMIVRISRGHTGRKVVFEAADKAALHLMLLGFAARILLPQLDPAHYLRWLHLAAGAWFGCFAILAWRYIPMLLQARIDGKEH
ncbi:MAG TPA: NnrS family protein [Rhodocyclaceae bacterium]